METIPLSPWLEHLAAHLPLAREGTDPEGVHQVRVALGRIDVWLAADGRRVLRDDVRWLRRGAGRVRDLDVLLGADPPAAWRALLEGELQAARVDLVRRLDEPRCAGLSEALGYLPPLSTQRLEQALARWTERVARRGRALEEQPDGLARYHALRRAVRRLRYGLEWAGRGTRPIKALQDALGELNDAAVTLDLLLELDPGRVLMELHERSRDRTEELRQRALEAWRASDLAREDGG